MKFLLDENLPPSFCKIFEEAGYQARHVYDVDLGNVDDERIVSFARQSGEIIATNDLDFSRIMALSGVQKPSIISFRVSALSYKFIREIVESHLEGLGPPLEKGALVSINEQGIRIRKLPLFR